MYQPISRVFARIYHQTGMFACIVKNVERPIRHALIEAIQTVYQGGKRE